MYRLGMASLTTDLAGAIQRMEGACSSGTCRNNNPGNLRAGPGSTGLDSRGFAIFPDLATGEAALEHQVDLNIERGLTLDEFFAGKPGVYAGYAPSGDSNNPSAYAASVAGWLGIDPNAVLAQPSGSAFDFSGNTPDTPAQLSGMVWLGLGIAAVGLLWATSG